MIVNLISVDNGVGLTQDMNIIGGILKEHICRQVDVKTNRCQKADINIFFEILNPYLYPFAKVNLFFPNPEWFWFRRALPGINLVLCKTRDAERIFKGMGCKTIYTSFTSRDLRADKEKVRAYLHLAGKSENKGTRQVFEAWEESFPELILCKTVNYERYVLHSKNITTNFKRMPSGELVDLMNTSYFHVCTSDYEGFGHYIWEAKSCGGIVITTAGEPMCDFVKDGEDGFLVKVDHLSRQQLGILQHISVESLKEVIRKTQDLTDQDLLRLSLNSRKSWESNDKFFREIFLKIIDQVRKW